MLTSILNCTSRAGENFMTVKTWLDLHTEDGQGQKATISLRIKDIAFAAAQTLPAPAKIDAIIAALFSVDASTPSNAKCLSYAVRVEEDTPTSEGGNGTSAISSAIKTRNDIEGIPGNWLLSIPGMNKDAVVFGTVDRNSIVVTGSMWAAVRTALADAAIAVGDPNATAYVATPSTDLIQEASAFDGRRAAPRPR
jgi:hypothetical protein